MKQFWSTVALALPLLFALCLAPACAQTFQILTEQSYLHVLTGRAGALKAFSHRHVVELGPLNGTVNYHAGQLSTAELTLKPAAFIVDQPSATAQYPEIWDKAVNASAAKGTTKNMLGEKLLDADHFPTIIVSIQLPAKALGPVIFKSTVIIKNQQFTFQIPGTLTMANGLLIADSEFTLNHGQLGLTPFRAAGGLFAVADKMQFTVHIVAQPSLP